MHIVLVCVYIHIFVLSSDWFIGLPAFVVITMVLVFRHSNENCVYVLDDEFDLPGRVASFPVKEVSIGVKHLQCY